MDSKRPGAWIKVPDPNNVAHVSLGRTIEGDNLYLLQKDQPPSHFCFFLLKNLRGINLDPYKAKFYLICIRSKVSIKPLKGRGEGQIYLEGEQIQNPKKSINPEFQSNSVN